MANPESNLLLNFRCAFNILGMDGVDTSVMYNEAAQNEVLNHTSNIALEVLRKLLKDNENFTETNKRWYGTLDPLSISLTKIGPVNSHFLYGYRVGFTLNPKFIRALDD